MDYSHRIQESVDYIEKNLTEKIELEELSKKAFLSKYYYHRIFHALVGEAVMEYIRKRRLSEAAKDLLESKDKILDIALRYQFGSQEAFTRAFKKMFQVSPKEFRKNEGKILLYKKYSAISSKDIKPSMESSIFMAA
ncbi:helix-turn-helix transcriptional regulator [Clostridium sp. 19966]|uniref:helix-turn-helix transcriptional regulator n=1 Tax=Clostridium sp. 19966 TaxID=2768166 RepID=UPI0028DF3417|nr:AraC family transcriptional regulator [Clostridium sp. 19966]MDT8719489.1 helix-turn-helix transcriptional regulator [Clostridium sp. 19966]